MENSPPKLVRVKLTRAKPLPMEVTSALKSSMLDHGDDMENLLWSTLMLDYESTSAMVDKKALAPMLSEVNTGGEGTVNRLLPSKFFSLQAELRESLGRLKSAADSKNDTELAAEYGKVAESCIRCHSVYLNLPGE
ncbi:MAG: cytochrome c [Kofleriaceae bacterium]|nr:cytochrome c [Kofleriaceae bacterium]